MEVHNGKVNPDSTIGSTEKVQELSPDQVKVNSIGVSALKSNGDNSPEAINKQVSHISDSDALPQAVVTEQLARTLDSPIKVADNPDDLNLSSLQGSEVDETKHLEQPVIQESNEVAETKESGDDLGLENLFGEEDKVDNGSNQKPLPSQEALSQQKPEQKPMEDPTAQKPEQKPSQEPPLAKPEEKVPEIKKEAEIPKAETAPISSPKEQAELKMVDDKNEIGKPIAKEVEAEVLAERPERQIDGEAVATDIQTQNPSWKVLQPTYTPSTQTIEIMILVEQSVIEQKSQEAAAEKSERNQERVKDDVKRQEARRDEVRAESTGERFGEHLEVIEVRTNAIEGENLSKESRKEVTEKIEHSIKATMNKTFSTYNKFQVMVHVKDQKPETK